MYDYCKIQHADFRNTGLSKGLDSPFPHKDMNIDPTFKHHGALEEKIEKDGL